MRRERIELAVFLLLIIPGMIAGIGARCTETFIGITTVTILRDISLVVLVLYFAWTNGERPAAFGLTTRKLPLEIAIGIVLYAAVWLALIAVGLLIGSVRWIETSSAIVPHGPGQTALAIVLVLVVAFAEELIFRGYLLRRLGAFGLSPVVAIVLSSVLFGAGHTYEGTSGVITASLLGAFFCVIYRWRRSLAAPIVMHFLQDLLAVVVIPALSR